MNGLAISHPTRVCLCSPAGNGSLPVALATSRQCRECPSRVRGSDAAHEILLMGVAMYNGTDTYLRAGREPPPSHPPLEVRLVPIHPGSYRIYSILDPSGRERQQLPFDLDIIARPAIYDGFHTEGQAANRKVGNAARSIDARYEYPFPAGGPKTHPSVRPSPPSIPSFLDDFRRTPKQPTLGAPCITRRSAPAPGAAQLRKRPS